MTKCNDESALARRWLGAGVSVLALALAAPAVAPERVFAQDAVEEIDDLEELDEVDEDDRVVVTGSRIRRDTFTSVKPVQVISGEVSRDLGLFDAASILQESTVASGLQIDQTFNGFVLDNGPGASTLDLRGLGASRSLVLINGRRVAPAGVEGAPGVPDLGLIPTSLVDRFDILLDGASSIYGSDAVAGVANAILRQDFDGLELEASRNFMSEAGGELTTLSANWGVNADRGFLGFGVEYQFQENLQLNDREVFGDCLRPIEETSDGEIRTTNEALARSLPAGSTVVDCTTSFGINRIFANPFGGVDPRNGSDIIPEFAFFGSLYYTPGTTNVGVPNFSELSLFGVDFDSNGDGIPDVDASSQFYQVNGSPQTRESDVLPENETLSMYTYGEYNIGGDLDVDAFFEAGFSNRQTRQRGDSSRALFPTIPSDNPFNPCNPDATGVQGADCGQAFNDTVAALFGVPLSGFGLQDAYVGARPVEAQIRVNLREGDDLLVTEVSQSRILGGFRGDLGIRDWAWEIFASYDRSLGQSTRTVFDDDRLALSLETTIEDPNNPGEFICGLDINGDGIPDPAQPFPLGGANESPECVPVNFFAPSLYQTGGGDFASDAEYDYLLLRRTFDTTIEQTVVGGTIDGDLFALPAGDVAGVLGFEYRGDSIDSDPDSAAARGDAFGFFSDEGATGSRDLYEVFAEIEFPLIAGQRFAEELTVNLSGRFTDESTFGSGTTYSISGNYRPVDFLTFAAGAGTSFRAPNLREQFLEGQSGFDNSPFDPCQVPETALGAFNQYDPTGDTREQTTLDNCIAAGVDPTTLGAGTGIPSQEIVTVQGSELQEETSTSWFLRSVVEQPIFDDLDARFSLTYYDITVEDTLVEFGQDFIIDQCYNQEPDLSSPLCGLITRDQLGFITQVDTPFVNQDEEIARGLDFNFFYEQDFTIPGGRALTFALDATVNHTLERTSVVRAPNDEPVTFELEGEEYFPEWNGTFRAFGEVGDYRITWNTRWIGEQANDNIQDFGINDTCSGIENGDVDCRNVGYVDDYFLHDLSGRYNAETWTIVLGVNNVLDEDPDLVDPSSTTGFFSLNNVPFNQDFLGRRFFVNVQKNF